jgi:dTMP kinase
MIIGLEGVSCTGKTTLARALAASAELPEALVVPCYYHAAPDPDALPKPVADTAEEQLNGLAHLLSVEGLRLGRAQAALDEGRAVIMDRTVDTLLAHTHAVGVMRGFALDEAAHALVSASPRVTPDLTLLLQTDPGELAARAARRPGMPAIFYAPAFTADFNAYFRNPLTPVCVRIDTGASLEDVARQALEHIRQIPSRNARREAA